MFISTIWTLTDQIFFGELSFLRHYSPLPPWLVPLGIQLIPGGRYTHSAWLRTASDTVSSLGTDP
jgi:hypothetical protein